MKIAVKTGVLLEGAKKIFWLMAAENAGVIVVFIGCEYEEDFVFAPVERWRQLFWRGERGW